MERNPLDLLVSKNQSIKIVPSVEESLRSMGLVVDLDDSTYIWFEQLKATWKTWKKTAAIEGHVEIFFRSIPDPFRVALVFMIKCEEYKDCKPKSLPYFLAETLLKWSQSSGVSSEEALKFPAFSFAVQQRSQHFLKLIVKTYELSTVKHMILPIVRDMMRNDNCKRASQIIIATELFDDIPVEDLLFPLILQDKNTLIDEYLTECPSQVKPLLVFLDKLLDKSVNVREYVQTYIEEHKISDIRFDKIHHKPLGKLVARLCNKFNIPIETCKHLSKNRTTGGLKYLIYQKYQEHNLSSSVWDDLVKDSLRQNASSGQEFIGMLVEFDKSEALRWAEYLNLSHSELPSALKELTLQDSPDPPLQEENWDTNVSQPEEYYKYSFSDDQIIIIDTGEKFYDLFTNLLKCNIVSIDCEWKPSFGASQSQVAIIQLASRNKVYLIDTLVLNTQEYASFWYTFYKSFLENAEMIKLGFGLEQDLKEMKSSIIGLGNIKVKGEGLLDLCLLWKALLKNGLTLPSNSDNGGGSLSSLVQSCFGLPLEKSEQCSNWELRPLRSTQIQYAALDAYILIQLYDFLQNTSQEQGIKFEEICNDVMLDRKKKVTKKPKVVDRIQSSLAPVELKSANEIKFLVDPKLSNLMCFLRYFGIDTSVMSQTMLWHDVINLAVSEDRMILLNKFKCSPTVNFPQSSIFDVGNGEISEQLQRIFTNFNIDIKQNDLITICFNCNSKDLKVLNLDEVQKICNDYSVSLNSLKSVNGCSNSENDDLAYDTFLSDSDCDEDLYQPIANFYPTNNCTTSSGVPIQISNVSKLSSTQKPATLCQACGKIFWDGDDLMVSVSDTVSKATNLSSL